MRPKLCSIAFAVLVVTTLCGCRYAQPPHKLDAPTVMVGVQNVTDTELARLERFFDEELPANWVLLDRAGTPRDASTGALERSWYVRLASWGDMKRLHASLSALRDIKAGHFILQNTQTDATLVYTSSQAESRSQALIRIRVTPPRAQLVFDSEVPGIGIGQPVSTQDGEFELKLPFGFIRSARRFVYFHSIYEGQYRYYRYDLNSERQELLRDVRSPEEFARYRR